MSTTASYTMDTFTADLFAALFTVKKDGAPSDEDRGAAAELFRQAETGNLTGSIVDLFAALARFHEIQGWTPEQLGLSRQSLEALAAKHERLDEHRVTVGGRVGQARPIVDAARSRVAEYLDRHPLEAPSGIEVWDRMLENQQRIKNVLGMSEDDWNSYSGQLRHAIEDVETLAKVVDLPERAVEDVLRVTKTYRMRLTPYYASLILPGQINDPVLLQSVPTGEMVDNAGVEIPPVAADHSPARLIDQFYPRVVTIKATNMCAMYCTHCLRLAHIGAKDRIYSKEAYGEALDYIRANPEIRDVLVTGGDSLVLPNSMLQWLLCELDSIEHVRMKRLGTRIPVTTPQRIDNELLDILEASSDKKPLRVVTQINTAQEITPVSKAAFRAISKRVAAVMNQAVLLKGINDSSVKMWKLCETIQEACVRPYYVFNCSYRNPQFKHLRVPVAVGQSIVESMYGNISGDAIPRYIATAGGKIPLHRTNVLEHGHGHVKMQKPWSGEQVTYPDPEPQEYARQDFGFAKYEK
ncbi:MAG: KamA family radical SAM protein [Desulfomicrobium sp.]|nr:KamA family radical SAM protein [Pseudomonadota bacterium]MBV1712479.1 KamA family radical SAM protein [Desulfomicrobium sp.]MBU4571191.1 KamA family radical SAM protein [Pseudomonadota bacterium]MBU4592928.1 KamA family radical SAM protein [Pseudomonadota bacterium]MBV1720550.1 KamA family radical SAM protein [Desulfomicrobium sp.]